MRDAVLVAVRESAQELAGRVAGHGLGKRAALRTHGRCDRESAAGVAVGAPS
jgi:hypothetical protein